MSGRTDIEQMAAAIAELQKQVRGLSRTPRLATSSVEAGALTVYDADGTLRQTIGLQADGTYTVVDSGAAAPPTPSAPLLTAHQLALTVTWDGACVDGGVAVPAPADLARVEVHVSLTAEFTPDASTLAATIDHAGGAVTVAGGRSLHYVRLVAVNTSGAVSTPCVEVIGEPLAVSQLEAGAVDGQTISGVTITADEFRTADSGRRMRMTDAYTSTFFYETGATNETRAGYTSMYVDPSGGCHLEIAPPRLGEGGDGFTPWIGLFEAYPGQRNSAQIAGQYLYLDGDVRISAPDDSILSACSVTAGLQSAYLQDWVSNANYRVAYIRPDGSAKFGGQEVKDSGWVAGASAFTGSNATVGSDTRARKYGAMCIAKLDVTYTGATLTASATGNLPDTLVGTLASGFRPTTARTAAAFRTNGGTGGSVHINSAGAVYLTDAHPGSTITYGDVIQIDAVFFTD